MGFIPVHRLANKTGIAVGKIYRAIREHKLLEGVDYVRVEKKVVRIEVREDLKLS